MASTTHSVLRGLGLAAMLSFALAPRASLERALDWTLAPLRVVAEVAAPLGWIEIRRTRASERALAERKLEDVRERDALAQAQAHFALPQDPLLRGGRSFLQAEAIGRPEGQLDILQLRVPSEALDRVAPGMPVASGDVYVGRIERTDRDRGLVFARLVTAGDFRVGARVTETAPEPQPLSLVPAEGIRLVLGGLDEGPTGRRGDVRLAVRHPSEPIQRQAWVRVDEERSGAERYRAQANGFLLGRLVMRAAEKRSVSFSVEAPVDFRGGLFRLVIVGPAGHFPDPGLELADVLASSDWIASRTLTRGDPARLRDSLKLALGALNGVETGAAVVFGARLVGRVVRAGPLLVDVQLLGEPGFALPALALVEGREQPLELGRIVSLGRAQGSRTRIRFVGALVRPEESFQSVQGAGDALRARVFSGSGEALLPAGLCLGSAELSIRGHVLELVLDTQSDLRDLSRVWVRLGRAVGSDSGGARP